MYENVALCAQCGGACCKAMPGSCYPEDFGMLNTQSDKDLLLEALNSGRYSVDWWEGDPRPDGDLPYAYYVRPSLSGYESNLFHAAWVGSCTFLSHHGCTLNANDRPKECRYIEPGPLRSDGSGCKATLHGDASKKSAALAWIPYFDFFEELRWKDEQCLIQP